MQSTDYKLVSRIYGLKRGSVVVPDRFLDLGSREAVDVALHRLVQNGTLRRLSRGVYYYPKNHPILGELTPSADAIAKALAGAGKLRLQPSGAYAANLLGLTEQVPMRVVYLTDGPSKKVRIGSQEIILKRTTPKNMAMAGKVSGLVVQALRHLGQKQVDDAVVEKLRSRLSPEDKRRLLRDAPLAPAWIAAIMRRIASDAE